MDKIRVSKTISYALRHNPKDFNLVLDDEGFVNIDYLLKGLINNDKYCKKINLTIEDIKEIVETDNKKRYEIIDNKIRAIYGHSTRNKINKKPSIPPDILYHGTTEEAYEKIKMQGLKSMQRQYVHLSQDIETAIIVAKRRTKNPIILKVNAKEANLNKVKFYKETNGIYLSEPIPPKFIELIEGDK